VISLSGDGGLAMLMGDLLSLRQLELPVKVLAFKNDSLAFVELEMKQLASSILEQICTTQISRRSQRPRVSLGSQPKHRIK